MRIADTMSYDQVRANIGKNRTQMAELQNQASTQKRVNKPSDDPIAASRVLGNRIDLQGNKQYVKNLNYAKSFLETTDQALGEISESLMRVKELAINQANDASANEESRQVVATEIDQIFNQIVNIGNRKLGDRFIFGGFKTQTKPFDINGDYFGDSGEMMLHLDKSTFLPMNVTGDRIFLGEGLSPDGTVKANREQATSIEEFRNRQTEGPDPSERMEPQDKAKVEVRAPASDGQESPEEKVQQEKFLAARNKAVNLFQVIKDLQISLRTNDKTGVQESLETLDSALTQVVMGRAQIGSRGMAVDGLLQSLEKAKVDNQVAISSHEDADVFATVSDMNKTEGTLQATLQTSGKMIQPSLLEFLR